jgi:hypothetical protein
MRAEMAMPNPGNLPVEGPSLTGTRFAGRAMRFIDVSWPGLDRPLMNFVYPSPQVVGGRKKTHGHQDKGWVENNLLVQPCRHRHGRACPGHDGRAECRSPLSSYPHAYGAKPAHDTKADTCAIAVVLARIGLNSAMTQRDNWTLKCQPTP